MSFPKESVSTFYCAKLLPASLLGKFRLAMQAFKNLTRLFHSIFIVLAFYDAANRICNSKEDCKQNLMMLSDFCLRSYWPYAILRRMQEHESKASKEATEEDGCNGMRVRWSERVVRLLAAQPLNPIVPLRFKRAEGRVELPVSPSI